MRPQNVFPFNRRSDYLRDASPPDHFRPDESRAWSDIVGSMAPLQQMEEVDMWFLELAAVALADFRVYRPHADDVMEARHGRVLREILEEALVPQGAIAELLRA